MPDRMTNSDSCPKLPNDERVIIVVFNFIFLFIGVLGNSAVIIYNIFLNRNKTPSSWLVTHLALADLLVCLILYPTKIVWFFYTKVRDEGLVFCKIKHTTIYVSLYLSIMILLFITIDKYMYLAKPLRYPLIVRIRRTKVLLSCILLTALVQFPLIYIHMHTNQGCKPDKCQNPQLVVWLHVILQLAAIFVTTILNYKMFKIVKKKRRTMASEFVLHTRQSEQEQHEQVLSEQNMTYLRHLAEDLKAMKTFAIVVGVLTCCFIPYIIVNMVCILDYGLCFSHTTYLIVLHLAAINLIANAFIYALRYKQYRRAYSELFTHALVRLCQQNN